MRTVRRTVLLSWIWLSGCSQELGHFPSGPEPTPAPFEQQRPTLSKSAVELDEVLKLVRQLVLIPFPGGSITVGYQNGYYVVKVVMFGSERSLQVQFQDSSGRPMRGYDPARTKAIRILTTTEDRSGLRHVDVIVRGVERFADDYRIQGNGRLVMQDTEVFFFLNSLVLAKVGNPYPLRGEVALETPHASGERSTVSFRFNGSRVVDGKLLSGSVSVYFTLDLISLDVQPREPTP